MQASKGVKWTPTRYVTKRVALLTPPAHPHQPTTHPLIPQVQSSPVAAELDPHMPVSFHVNQSPQHHRSLPRNLIPPPPMPTTHHIGCHHCHLDRRIQAHWQCHQCWSPVDHHISSIATAHDADPWCHVDTDSDLCADPESMPALPHAQCQHQRCPCCVRTCQRLHSR